MSFFRCPSCGYAEGHGQGCPLAPPPPTIVVADVRDVNVRDTSAQAFADITREGVPNAQGREVWRYLMANGPRTGREVDHALASSADAAASYHKRLSELLAAGWVEEAGKRPCSITGRRTIAWRARPIRDPAKIGRVVRITRLEALAREFEEDPDRMWSGEEVAAMLRRGGDGESPGTLPA